MTLPPDNIRCSRCGTPYPCLPGCDLCGAPVCEDCCATTAGKLVCKKCPPPAPKTYAVETLEATGQLLRLEDPTDDEPDAFPPEPEVSAEDRHEARRCQEWHDEQGVRG